MSERAALRASAAHVFVDDLDRPQLDERDEHHLARVLRLRDGEVVTVGDGRGSWRTARWHKSGPIVDGPSVTVPAPRTVTIAAAIPKGDRVDWMVQKLVEVGVMCIVLVDCRRSVVRWQPERRATQLDRLRRVGRDAAMQSRRVWLPAVRGPVPLADVRTSGGDVVMADPDGVAFERIAVRPAVVVIGPEGGWDPAETSAAQLVSLGDHVLRVETAAVVAAVLAGRSGDVGWC